MEDNNKTKQNGNDKRPENSSEGPCTGDLRIHLDACELFDPIAKIWSSFRKRIRKDNGMDLIATFTPTDTGYEYSILPNRVNPETMEDYNNKDFSDRWNALRKHLPKLIDSFENLLKDFKKSNEFQIYQRLLEHSSQFSSDSPFHKVFDQYLKRKGVKLEEDERIKKEFAKKLAEIKKNMTHY